MGGGFTYLKMGSHNGFDNHSHMNPRKTQKKRGKKEKNFAASGPSEATLRGGHWAQRHGVGDHREQRHHAGREPGSAQRRQAVGLRATQRPPAQSAGPRPKSAGVFFGSHRGSLHYTPEHCLVNGGVLYFGGKSHMFQMVAKCICSGAPHEPHSDRP